jgi:voltage-gated potassium channel
VSTPALVEDPDDDVTVGAVRRVGSVDAPTRERWATVIADRLDGPMAALGMVFLLVVLGQTLATTGALQRGLAAVGWLLWAVFVAEFVLRLYVAADRRRFLRRNWWQIIFLIVPVLRFLRLVLVLRVARAGRVVSSAVRSSRSAGRLITSRLSWLAVVSVIMILSTSQLLYAFVGYDTYGDALHAAALGTISGAPLGRDHAFAQVVDVVLAVYSVGVFAAVAGAVGAYFVEGRERTRTKRNLPG